MLLIILFKGAILRFRKLAEVMMLVAPPNYDQRDLKWRILLQMGPKEKRTTDDRTLYQVSGGGVGWRRSKEKPDRTV